MRLGIDGRSLEKPRRGVARYLVNLLQHWSREYPHHEFFLYFASRPAMEGLVEDARLVPRVPGRVSISTSNVNELLWEQLVLPRALTRDRVDIFLSPAYTIPLAFRGCSVVTIHDVSYEARPDWSPWPQRLKLRFFSRAAARNASAILTDSAFSKQELLKHYRLPASKVHAIALAADDFLRQPPEGKAGEVVEGRFGVKADYLLFVGSIFPRRRISTLLEAFELALKDGGPSSLVLVGADCLRGRFDLSRAIEALNLRLGRRAVLHLPRVEENELLCLYNAATAFIFLSDYEGFGLTLLEAMACGSPVISARTSSIPEVVGEAAFLVSDPADPLEVSRGILAVAEDAARREEMIQKGLEQASAFSWRRCARETMRVLEQCGRTVTN